MDKKKLLREAELTQYMFNRACQKKVPLSGTFELSPVCNFTCRMCYVRKSVEEVKASPRKMISCSQWIEMAKKLREAGMLYLLLTGGEPFLWPDFWELYEALSEMGFLISINTNGSLIDAKTIERLKKNCPTRINVTLYGASDETYEALCQAKGMFSKVDRNITALRDAGIPVKINCSLTPHNVHDLEKIVNYAKEKDLLLSATTYMFPPIRRDSSMVGQNERFTPYEAALYNLERYRLQHGEEQYYKYLEQLKEGIAAPPGLDESCIDPKDGSIRCRAGKASFWITWDGWLTSCGMLPEPKVDLTECDITEGWKRLTEKCEATRLSRVCNECPNRKVCHACAATAMAETGSTSGISTYLCEKMAATKEIAEERLSEKKKNNKEEVNYEK